jgi:hypothetical protein
MARLKGDKLSGAAGKLTYRESNGIQIAQQKPEHINQTPASKKAGILFGKASALSSQIRSNLTPFFAEFTDGGLHNRLTAELNPVIQHYFDKETEQFNFEKESFNRMCGLDLNLDSKMKDFLWAKLDISLNGLELIVKLPELKIGRQLEFPISADSCELKIAVNLFALERGYHRHDLEAILDIEFTQQIVPAQQWIFPVMEGCLCIVGVAILYSRVRGHKTYMINNKDFSPAIICAAIMIPGEFILPVAPISNTATSVWYSMEVDFAGFK